MEGSRQRSSACQGRRQKQDCPLMGTEESLGGTGVQGDGWAINPSFIVWLLLQSSVWSQETGLGVPLLLLSSLHHTCTCACPPCSYTHQPWGALAITGQGLCGRSLQAGKLCSSPPTSTVEGTLGSRPRKGSTASWFM